MCRAGAVLDSDDGGGDDILQLLRRAGRIF
jgi:hypothetical protein